jgi:hypothetical protein
LVRGDLPSIVFSDDPLTKMHDSLPMVLFRFECLVKLYEAKELGWVGCFLPWVFINEAKSRIRMSNQSTECIDLASHTPIFWNAV